MGEIIYAKFRIPTTNYELDQRLGKNAKEGRNWHNQRRKGDFETAPTWSLRCHARFRQEPKK